MSLKRTTLRLGLRMKIMVLLDTVKELLSALRVSNVLNTDVHSLLDVAVADDFVHDNTNGGRSYVVDNPCASGRGVPVSFIFRRAPGGAGPRGGGQYVPMVVFMRHTLLLCCVCLDVHDIANTISQKKC